MTTGCWTWPLPTPLANNNILGINRNGRMFVHMWARPKQFNNVDHLFSAGLQVLPERPGFWSVFFPCPLAVTINKIFFTSGRLKAYWKRGRLIQDVSRAKITSLYFEICTSTVQHYCFKVLKLGAAVFPWLKLEYYPLLSTVGTWLEDSSCQNNWTSHVLEVCLKVRARWGWSGWYPWLPNCHNLLYQLGKTFRLEGKVGSHAYSEKKLHKNIICSMFARKG